MSQSFLRTLVSLSFAALLLMCMGVEATAQEQQVNGTWTWAHSPGTGHKDGLGFSGEVVVRPKKELVVVGRAGMEWTAKGYLGNGNAKRADLNLRYIPKPSSVLKPFGQVGVAVVNNTTSDYSKTARFLTAGGGVDYNNLVIAEWRHFFRENQTLNRGSSDKFNLGVYIPFERNSRWLAVVNVFVQRTKFTQPNGPDAGVHRAWSTGVGFGVGYKF